MMKRTREGPLDRGKNLAVQGSLPEPWLDSVSIQRAKVVGLNLEHLVRYQLFRPIVDAR